MWLHYDIRCSVCRPAPFFPLLFLLAGLLACPSLLLSAAIRYSRFYVDTDYGGNGKPGFVRSGDMDNDGDTDIVAGGGYALFVYENDGDSSKENWTRHGNLDGTGQVGSNGAVLLDPDGDGDLDVVGAKYESDIGWWENPGPPLRTTTWTFHKLAGASGLFLHDCILADLDGDGTCAEVIATLNQGYWNSRNNIRWYRCGSDPTGIWEENVVEDDRAETEHCHAGLDTGDVDNDGYTDIGFSNGWYEASDTPGGSWTWHGVTSHYGISNVALRDLDSDGDPDLIVSCGHHGDGVFWLECPPDPAAGSWATHTVDGAIVNPEGLAVLDLDRDGDYDIVACDLDFSHWDQEVHHVYVYENVGTVLAPAWEKEDVSGPSYASHKLQATDVNQDGREDIISEGCGYRIVTYYENTTLFPTSVPRCGDYDGDGTVDIAVFRGSSGLWAVRNFTRLYFGDLADLPVPGDYNGDGTTDIGIFRGASGLWAVRRLTRYYFGSSVDTAIPADPDGDGTCEPGIFRTSSGLWAFRGVTRAYFGASGDLPVSGDYDGDGSEDISLFRTTSGLWALRGISRIYFGSSGDDPVPGNYSGSGYWTPGIFRSISGLWTIRGITRAYFGSSSDEPVPADYDGDVRDDIGIFRDSSGLWAVPDITRFYFGSPGDIPVTR